MDGWATASQHLAHTAPERDPGEKYNNPILNWENCLNSFTCRPRKHCFSFFTPAQSSYLCGIPVPCTTTTVATNHHISLYRSCLELSQLQWHGIESMIKRNYCLSRLVPLFYSQSHPILIHSIRYLLGG